jgi:hypothetical protein
VAGLGDLVVLDSNAPGTKYSGPVTVYFHEETDGTFTMYYFLRLKRGNELYSFAGFTANVDPSPNELGAQVCIIEAFIKRVVIPVVEECSAGVCDDCDPCDTGDCPTAVLKSFSQDVAQGEPPEGNPQLLTFYILNIVIAAQN